METFLTIIIALFTFGFLIFIHEFGHYITARLFKVTVLEFAIGMGPTLLSYRSKKTDILYSLRIFPIGGFVAMAGEDEESDDPNAFNKKAAWKRFIITAAGATVNIVAGFLVMIIIVCATKIGSTTVVDFQPKEKLEEYGYTYYGETELESGDTILSVNGRRVSILDELSYEISRQGNEPVDLLVLRDGREILLQDVRFPTYTSQGQTFGSIDFRVSEIEKNFFNVFSLSFQKAGLILRTCWESIYDLITGRYTVEAVSGPVGISEVIGQAASSGRFEVFLEIVVIISINLGFMNLLPIPALDGGRLLCVLIEMITRKKIPARIEAIINGVGLVLLLGLSVIILIKDVVQLF